jgi:hypothetical protein
MDEPHTALCCSANERRKIDAVSQKQNAYRKKKKRQDHIQINNLQNDKQTSS